MRTSWWTRLRGLFGGPAVMADGQEATRPEAVPSLATGDDEDPSIDEDDWDEFDDESDDDHNPVGPEEGSGSSESDGDLWDLLDLPERLDLIEEQLDEIQDRLSKPAPSETRDAYLEVLAILERVLSRVEALEKPPKKPAKPGRRKKATKGKA